MIQSVYTCDGCGTKVSLAANPNPVPNPPTAPPWWLELYTVRALGPRPAIGAPVQTESTQELFCSVQCLTTAARLRFEHLLDDAIQKGDGDPVEQVLIEGLRIERKQLESPMTARAKT